jgi:predicted dinucleotide-binding enzyme
LGGRNAQNDKARAWATKSGPKASAGSFRDAAEFGELVVLATLWTGTENAIRLADPELCVGKVVIDVTNPLLFAPNELPRLALGHSDSGGEQVQRWLPGARVVKAFNIVGNAHMVDPDFPGGSPDMFICGDDAEAKATVADMRLVRLAGHRHRRSVGRPRARAHVHSVGDVRNPRGKLEPRLQTAQEVDRRPPPRCDPPHPTPGWPAGFPRFMVAACGVSQPWGSRPGPPATCRSSS